MWSLAKFRTETVQGRDGERPIEVKDQTLPFCVDGELRIPGSSLRGMIRSLVEILGCSPLEPINENPLYFRAVAASPNPRNLRFFEPQAKTYRARIGKVEAGYLYGGSGYWEIHPATRDALELQYYKIGEDQEWKIERDFWFTARRDRALASRRGAPEAVRGTLVCSGHVPGKRNQWVINEEDSGPPIKIPTQDVDTYRRTGVSYELRKHPKFIYSVESHGAPCFYVEWSGRDGSRRVAFGHTRYFRIPYETKPPDAVPRRLRRP